MRKWERGVSKVTIFLLCAAGVCGYLQVLSNALLATVVTVSIGVELARRMDCGIPLLQMTALVACLQWLVGPALAYGTGLMIGRYVMYVPEPDYFSFVLPATCAFAIGLLGLGVSVHQERILGSVDRSQFLTIGILLNVISFVADFMGERIPSGLAFFIHLLSQLRYLGAIYFLLSGHPWRWALAAIAFLPLIMRSTESAVFHDLIIWGILIFFYWLATKRRTVLTKLVIIGLGCIVIFTIQMVKQIYRAQTNLGMSASYLEDASDLWMERQFNDKALALAVARLNQGWIVSAVLANVPDVEPFAKGETIMDAVLASLVPRAIWAEKKQAGGQENFRRFTGLGLEETTSMGISVLGESYANFDRQGGIVFMLVYGVVFAMAFQIVAIYAVKHPTFLLWIPLIFYQAVKAETELVVVLNQIAKGSIVAFGCYYIIFRTLMREPGSHAKKKASSSSESRKPVVGKPQLKSPS